jgi:hypothetical protein
MAGTVRVMTEHGPKGKRVVVCAIDWPGWSRGAKTEDTALDVLESYRERYRPVAEAAGLASEFDAAGGLEIVERIEGSGSTDFWGISFSSGTHEQGPMSEAELERKTALLQASWTFFDDVSNRVSAELRKGPRGGGRDRDQIISHTFGTEREMFGKKIGVLTPPGVMLTPDGLREHREAYINAIRAYNAEGKSARNWTLQFLIRHSAFHVLDHAWEMEDKDLSDGF